MCLLPPGIFAIILLTILIVAHAADNLIRGESVLSCESDNVCLVLPEIHYILASNFKDKETQDHKAILH